jgi:hypothetical protein
MNSFAGRKMAWTAASCRHFVVRKRAQASILKPLDSFVTVYSRYLSSSVETKGVYSRYLSSSVDSKESNEVIIYERPVTRNNLILKSSMFIATFHTGYWIWYIADFIPLVNASDIPDLHIDPIMGWTGFIFALAIQAVVVIYPKQLVSRLSFQHNQETNDALLKVYTYSLLVRPSTRPTAYKVGQLTLNPESTEAQQILTEYRGNAKLFRGKLGLKASNTAIPYIVEVQHDDDVKEPELLLQVLLPDKDLPKQARKDAGVVTKQTRRKMSVSNGRKARPRRF